MDTTTIHAPSMARRRSRLFLAAPALLIAMAVIGFWPQYYGRLANGRALEGVAAHPLVHVHSTLFIGWLLIMLAQAALAQGGNLRLHRRLGLWLAAVGYAAAATGLVAGLNLAGAKAVRDGSLDAAAVFVAAPILDMITFTSFLTAAVVYRRRPEIHKRLILFTGYSFAFVGLVRFLSRIPGVLENLWLSTLLLMAPIGLAIAWEAATRRAVHPVWWIGLAAFTARLLIELAALLPAWLPIGRAIVRPFL